MSNYRKLATLTAIAALVAFGFGGVAHAADQVENLTADNGDGLGGFNVGTVTVSDAGADITVTFDRTGTFLFVVTHVHAVKEDDCSTVPQTGNGNPKVGKFDFANEHGLPGVTTSVHTISKTIFAGDGNTIICIAAHAEVYDSAADADPATAFALSEESAWGDGDDGTEFAADRNWATFFTVDLSAL